MNRNLAISQDLYVNASGVQDTTIEIGAGTASNHYAYIDLIGDATYTDYGLRIIRNNGGANTSSYIYHRGTGNFNIETQEAAAIKLRTAGTDAVTIDSSQDATFAGGVYIGSADTTNGTLTIHGGGTGNNEGGEIRLATAADHDSVYNFYRIDVNSDDLRFGREGETDLIIKNTGSIVIEKAADGLIFPSSHSEDKIRLYDGGSEKIGTASGQLILTGNTINFKKVSGVPNLAINGTTFLNSSIELTNIASINTNTAFIGNGNTNNISHGALVINHSTLPQILFDGGGDTNLDIAVPNGEILQIGHWNTTTNSATLQLSMETDGDFSFEGNNIQGISNVSTSTITASSHITISGDNKQLKFTGTAGPLGLEFGDSEANPNFRVYYRTTPNTLTFENNGETAKHTWDLDGDYTAVGTITSSSGTSSFNAADIAQIEIGDGGTSAATDASNIGSKANYLLLQRDEALPIEIWGSRIESRSTHYFGGGSVDAEANIDTSGNFTTSGVVTINSASAKNALVLSGTSPTMAFTDTTSGHDNFWIHVNSNNFYVLCDRDGSTGAYNTWETPHALQLEADTNTGYLFSYKILTTADEGSGNGIDADTVDGIQGASFLRSDANDTCSGLITFTQDISVGSQIGTWITSDVMSDAIGWNNSYGVYIGSDIGGTHYLRGNGTFTTGGSTYNLWHQGNDGSGSGLDADTLDGVQASNFLRSNVADTATQAITFSGGIVVDGSIDSGGSDYGFYQSAGTNIILKGDASGRSGIFFQSEKNGTNINHPSDYGFIQFHSYGYGGSSGESIDMVIGTANDSDDHLILQTPYTTGLKFGYRNATSGTGLTQVNIWHAANDGSGSGLDADTLDGINSGSFLRSDADDTLTGHLQINSHAINMDLNNVADDAITMREVRSSTWPLQILTNAVGNDNHSGFWVGSNGYPDMRLRRDDSTVRALISSWETSYVSNGFNVAGGNFGIANSNPSVTFHAISSGANSQFYFQSPTPIIRGVDSNLTTRYWEIGGENGSCNIAVDPGNAQGSSTFGITIDGQQALYIDSDDRNYVNTTTNPTANNATGHLNVLADLGDGVNIKHTVNGNNIINIWQTGGTQCNALAFYKGNSQTLRGRITLDDLAANGVSYVTSSDYRLKENIVPLPNATTRLMAMNPVQFDWIESGGTAEGFIAHELAEQYPGAVVGEKDAVFGNGDINPQGVDYGRITPLLVKTIQEQQALIESLQTRIEALEGE